MDVDTLALFDIDGTLLIGAADAHRDAIHAAMRRVYHLRDTERARIETAGRTDVQIARAIAQQLGLSAVRFDDGVRDLKRVAAEEYARRCPADLSRCVAPGVADLLAALAARGDVILSLVTGNLETIARIKLARAGIGPFFARGQGGFGSDHEDRTELPAVARSRAGRPGAPHPRSATVVIGDTPLDVACARADGVRCIALTTGPYDAAALAAADEVVASARQVAALV
jgi:phosphoglycolate phosphatase